LSDGPRFQAVTLPLKVGRLRPAPLRGIVTTNLHQISATRRPIPVPVESSGSRRAVFNLFSTRLSAHRREKCGHWRRRMVDTFFNKFACTGNDSWQ